jgi:hypothetical protein
MDVEREEDNLERDLKGELKFYQEVHHRFLQKDRYSTVLPFTLCKFRP